jgi:hypothetical protein
VLHQPIQMPEHFHSSTMDNQAAYTDQLQSTLGHQ